MMQYNPKDQDVLNGILPKETTSWGKDELPSTVKIGKRQFLVHAITDLPNPKDAAILRQWTLVAGKHVYQVFQRPDLSFEKPEKIM